MIDAIFGFLVEGVKQFASSEIGHHAMRHAAIHAGKAIDAAIDRKLSSNEQPKAGQQSDLSQFCSRLGRIIKCKNCGKDVSASSLRCWNCDAIIE